MAVLTATIPAGLTATLLYKNNSYAVQEVIFTTHGNSADVYVGNSNVTPTSNGVVFPKSQTNIVTVPPGEALYCAGNGTDTVKWLTFTDDYA